MGKVTKKMLTPLDRAEIRKIVIVGMGMEPLEAYTKKEGETISWIQERAEDFASLDLETIGAEQFRPNVVAYLQQLQQFILGNSKAPTFPTGGATEEAVEAEEGTAVTVEPPKKRKRGRPRKNPVVETAATEETVEAAPAKRKRGRPRKTTTDAKAATKTATKKQETTAKKKKGGFRVKKTAAEAVEVVKEEIPTTTPEVTLSVGTDLNSFLTGIDSLRGEVQAMRAEQAAMYADLHDALVYILNTAIIEDDDDLIKDLSQLKK